MLSGKTLLICIMGNVFYSHNILQLKVRIPWLVVLNTCKLADRHTSGLPSATLQYDVFPN